MAHIAESQHWYGRDGSPIYEVPSADGKKMVTPDIRHARKVGLVPGFTAVGNILAKPQLAKWKEDQMMLAALTLPRLPNEPDEAFLKRVREDAKAHSKERAEEGTEIHKAIEQFLRGEAYDTRWHGHVVGVLKKLQELPPDMVGDFKTKPSLEGKTERDLFFDEHIMQLACYRRGLGARAARTAHKFLCETTFAHPSGYGGRVDVHGVIIGPQSPLVSIMISVSEPGNVMCKVWTEEEAERGLAMFDHALALWKLKNRYDSGWTP
jgi:hypothetical protein